jgi:hypothetical protein
MTNKVVVFYSYLFKFLEPYPTTGGLINKTVPLSHEACPTTGGSGKCEAFIETFGKTLISK